MAKIEFLTILLTVTCFLGGVVSVTDKELEVCGVFWCNLSVRLLQLIQLFFKKNFQDRLNRVEHQLQKLTEENEVRWI